MRQKLLVVLVTMSFMLQVNTVYSEDDPDSGQEDNTESLCRKLAMDEDLDNGELQDYMAVCRDNIKVCAASAAREGVDEAEYYQYLKECIYSYYMDEIGDDDDNFTVMMRSN